VRCVDLLKSKDNLHCITYIIHNSYSYLPISLIPVECLRKFTGNEKSVLQCTRDIDIQNSNSNVSTYEKRFIWKFKSSEMLSRVCWWRVTEILKALRPFQMSITLYRTPRLNVPEEWNFMEF